MVSHGQKLLVIVLREGSNAPPAEPVLFAFGASVIEALRK